jgi:ADP-ribose pyrophosphatase
MNERMYLFLAEELKPGVQDLEVGEEIETVILSWDEAIAGIFNGTIRDGKTMIGLLLWDHLRNALP